MRKWVPAPLVGLCFGSLFVVYTLVGAVPLFAAGLISLAVPGTRLQAKMKDVVRWVAMTWIRANRLQMRLWHPGQFHFNISETITPDRQYMAIANHQSWVDIIVVQAALVDHAPMIKFFLKDNLRYLPVIGQVAIFLDMPFMKRHSRAELEKNPEKRGEDFETTRRSVAHFKDTPLTLLSFLEGTRFTPDKHARSKSAFRSLLPPKAGGMAFALGAFDGQVTQLLDITVSYPCGLSSFWGFMCGKIPMIHIDVSEHDIPETLQGKNYGQDKAFRTEVQAWIRGFWAKKDVRLEDLKTHYAGATEKYDPSKSLND